MVYFINAGDNLIKETSFYKWTMLFFNFGDNLSYIIDSYIRLLNLKYKIKLKNSNPKQWFQTNLLHARELKKNTCPIWRTYYQGKLNIVPGRISTVGPGKNLGRFYQ